MLRKVKVENPGDTKFLPGEVVDKFRFRFGNESLAQMLKIEEPGDTGFTDRRRRHRDELKEINAKAEEKARHAGQGQAAQDGHAPRRCSWASPRRRCRANRFVSAASFQETTKVLTEAAIAGKETRWWASRKT